MARSQDRKSAVLKSSSQDREPRERFGGSRRERPFSAASRSKSALLARSTLCLLFALAGAGALQAQTPPRDPQGIVVLTQAVNAAGGTAAVTGIQDCTATGTITFNWPEGPTQGNVTAYGKGLSEFRMDASVNGGTQSFIVNQGGGELLDLTGAATPIPFYNLITAGSLALPAVRIANALNDTTVGISYVGLVTWNNAQAQQVHISQPADPGLAAQLSGVGSFDFYFDPNSFQILGFSENLWPNGNGAQVLPHQVVFSAYSTVNGLSVPFSITETVNGQQTWAVSLTSAQFNTGLSDSLFTF